MLLVATEKDEDPASALSPQNAPGEMPESSYMAFVPHSPPEKRGLAGYVLLAYSFASHLFVFTEDRERGENVLSTSSPESGFLTMRLLVRVNVSSHRSWVRPPLTVFEPVQMSMCVRPNFWSLPFSIEP